MLTSIEQLKSTLYFNTQRWGTVQLRSKVTFARVLVRTQKWGSQTRFRDASETRATRVSNAGETRLRRGQYAFKTRANVTLDLSCTVLGCLLWLLYLCNGSAFTCCQSRNGYRYFVYTRLSNFSCLCHFVCFTNQNFLSKHSTLFAWCCTNTWVNFGGSSCGQPKHIWGWYNAESTYLLRQVQKQCFHLSWCPSCLKCWVILTATRWEVIIFCTMMQIAIRHTLLKNAYIVSYLYRGSRWS